MKTSVVGEQNTSIRSLYAIAILLSFVFVVFVIRDALSILFPSVKGYRLWLVHSAIQCLTCLTAAMMLSKSGLYSTLHMLRVIAPARSPILMATVATIPFPIVFYTSGATVSELDSPKLFFLAVLFPFVEELVYRGFAFWLLHRLAKWTFWPSAIVPALVFSYSHIYQANGFWNIVGVLLITGAGAIWFSWLLLRWNSLWAPVAMHVLMNGWWEIFEIDSTALGGSLANVARTMSIGLSIALTLRWNWLSSQDTSSGD